MKRHLSSPFGVTRKEAVQKQSSGMHTLQVTNAEAVQKKCMLIQVNTEPHLKKEKGSPFIKGGHQRKMVSM